MKIAAFSLLSLSISAVCCASARADDFYVTNLGDSGAGSLRKAITLANKAPAAPGGHRILFAIPPDKASLGTFSIELASALPEITANGLLIDGASQTANTGNTNPLGPEIQLKAQSGAINGLRLSGDRCVLRALALGGFFEYAVRFEAVQRGRVSGCFIGVGARRQPLGNEGFGIMVMGGSNVSIGLGPTEPLTLGATKFLPNSNLISGNSQSGVFADDTQNLTVRGNRIGTDFTGEESVSNSVGVETYVSAGGAIEGNLISGNAASGIVGGGNSGVAYSQNVIGLDRDGAIGLGNGAAGMLLDNCDRLQIGVPGRGGNVVSGNRLDGIALYDCERVTLVGNTVGLSRNRDYAVGNRHSGIYLAGGTQACEVGRPGIEPNYLAGNGSREDDAQLRISGESSDFNKVLNNRIGINTVNQAVMPVNPTDGIRIDAGAMANTIGAPGGANIIGGSGAGITISGFFTAINTVQSNLIGMGRGGRVIANDFGVQLEDGTTSNLVGGNSPGEGNVISGNGTGVLVTMGDTDSQDIPFGNDIQGNFIGTDGTGDAPTPNIIGVQLRGASNVLGGDGPGEGNIISGNRTDGVQVMGAEVVEGNFIGVGKSGFARGNGRNGVSLFAETDDSRPGQVVNNVIGANRGDGIHAYPVDFEASNIIGLGYFIDRNYIGTNRKGAVDLGNLGNGLTIEDQPNLLVGDESGGNVISGNLGYGVRLSGSKTQFCTFASNTIGTNRERSEAIANQKWGVLIEKGANFNFFNYDQNVGRAQLANVVSGNELGGVLIRDSETATNLIGPTRIGLGNGNTVIPNGGDGIRIENASFNSIGSYGASALGGAIIGGNKGSGVVITGSEASGNAVYASRIGYFSNVSGHFLVPNQLDGIVIKDGAHGNLIGHNFSGAGNIVAGNAGIGLLIEGSQTHENVVTGNIFGMASAPNRGAGILIYGARVNRIGLEAENEGQVSGNIITANGGGGVVITGASAAQNWLTANSIYANVGLGVNLMGGREDINGVTANDAFDTDSGPNTLQNSPVLLSTQLDESTGEVVVNGRLQTGAGQKADLEFFGSSSRDMSGYGEGQRRLAKLRVLANSEGEANFVLRVPIGEFDLFLSANATVDGSTGEFSNTLGRNEQFSPPSSGRMTSAKGS